jgi:probable F420-dependent oxidoreductase
VLCNREAKGSPWAHYYTVDRSFHEPLTLFAYASALTTKIIFASAVLVLPQRQATVVAKQAAEVDQLSGGRLRLGCGIGWSPEEYKGLGMHYGTRARRFEEQIEVMRRLWTEEAVTFNGDFHQIDDMGINPKPIQQPIPIWIGAFEENAVRRAVRLGDGYSLNPRAEPNDETRRLLERVSQWQAEFGRDSETYGLNATIHHWERGEAAWEADLRGWQELGVSHASFRTIDSDLPDPKSHLTELEKFAKLAGLKG